jgi:2'-5' RNA ligase
MSDVVPAPNVDILVQERSRSNHRDRERVTVTDFDEGDRAAKTTLIFLCSKASGFRSQTSRNWVFYKNSGERRPFQYTRHKVEAFFSNHMLRVHQRPFHPEITDMSLALYAFMLNVLPGAPYAAAIDVITEYVVDKYDVDSDEDNPALHEPGPGF